MSEFKVGEEYWSFCFVDDLYKTIEPSDIDLTTYMATERSVKYCFPGFKSKQEAIDSMIARLQELKDD